jgi:hypothetical protein
MGAVRHDKLDLAQKVTIALKFWHMTKGNFRRRRVLAADQELKGCEQLCVWSNDSDMVHGHFGASLRTNIYDRLLCQVDIVRPIVVARGFHDLSVGRW